MKAAVLQSFGTPEVAQFLEPRPGDGTKVVDMLMAGINTFDLIIASGCNPDFSPALPSVVGSEGVGMMDGKRVYFQGTVAPFGTIAERSLIDPRRAFNVPDHLSNEQAIVLGVPASTAWCCLSHGGKIQPGENVLILGATGAVGRMAVEAAKLQGAGRVIAAGRNQSVLGGLKAVGASATVTLTDDIRTLSTNLAEASEGRIDIIIDLLWGPYATAALLAASPGARLIAVGFAAAPEFGFSTAIMMVPQTTITGFSMLGVPDDIRRDTFAMLAKHARDGLFNLPTEIYGLDNLQKAWARQSDSPNAKLIIDPSR